MTDRRNFLKLSVAAASATLLSAAPGRTAAQPACYPGVVYTTANPGKWAKKAGSHAPVITVDGQKVTVETKHGMSPNHYIVRHTLVLADGTVVGAKTFSPEDKAVSSYTLPPGYRGVIRATSFCNLHDFWLTEATV